MHALQMFGVLVLWTSTWLSPSIVSGKDWPKWRGPNRNAVSAETGLLKSWNRTPNQAWHATDLGKAYSSIVVSKGRVFTMGRIANDVFCFAMRVDSGERIWATKIGTTKRNVMSTPTAHDGLVYALDPDGELVCLRVSDGTIVWQRSFLQDFGGRLMSGRGYGESPLVDGDRLICTPGGADAMIVALDRRTGADIWKTKFPDVGPLGRSGAAFSSIVVATTGGVRQFIQLTGRGLVGINASTGQYLWGYNDITNKTANIPTPIVHGNLVFCANGYHAGSVLLRLTADKDGAGVGVEEVYRLKGNRFQNHHGGFVLIGKHVYGGHGSNNGLPTCLEFETGKIVWRSRGPGTGSAATVAADGHVVFRYQNGVVALIEASPVEYRLKGTFNIPGAGGDSWSHPVIADGKLFLREQNDLWVYQVRQLAKPPQPTPSRPQLTPDLTAMVKLAAKIQHLPHNEFHEGRNRFYAVAKKPTRELAIITLTNQHLIDNGSLKPKVVLALRNVESPFVLNLAGTPVTADGLGQVARFETMVGLNVELCRHLTDDDFGSLRNAKQLVVLIAAGTSISDRGIAHISQLPNLAALDLEVCDNVADPACKVLGQMRQLRVLNLRKTAFEAQKVTGAGLSQLVLLPKLKALNISGNSINDGALKHLESSTSLRELKLNRLAITDAGLKHVSGVKPLQRLELIYSEGFGGPIVTDAGIKHLRGLSQLQTLTLVGARITNGAVDDLAELQQLRRLKVVGTRITPSELRRLKTRLPRLEQ